ncbi:MAG: Polysaccharide deacetylase family protein [Firmicutes bacterium]|nr:Polysaccharide deacetylase family protein [Bacillota bacterium]MDI6704923.1 polysaccharide deacetylase family protein [Bacillota bacterium]
MKRIIVSFLAAVVVLAVVLTFSRFITQTGEILSKTRFNWYEAKTQKEIENGNALAEERLEKKFYVFVNGIFLDVGYDWDGVIYVPIRSISESLNWQANWIPDLGVIQLVKDEEEAYVDIVNFFGKGYVSLERLEELLKFEKPMIHGGNIEIYHPGVRIASIDIGRVRRLTFYMDGMKMTDRAIEYQGQQYIPSRIFAMSLGRVFRYDATQGLAYIDDNTIEGIFVDGDAYSTLEQLKNVEDTGELTFEFRNLTPSEDQLMPVISKGPEEKVMALTFDDYLGDKVWPLLDVLDRYGVKGTFFVIGNSIEANKELLMEISERGHELANHTWDHYNNHTLTDDEVRAQLISTQVLIHRYTGQKPRYFRPPGGYYDRNMVRIAQDIGLQTVLWSLNSTDADKKNSAGRIKGVVTQWAHPGAIVVMHLNRETTVDSLPGIIATMKDRGYRFVTVSEIIGKQ